MLNLALALLLGAAAPAQTPPSPAEITAKIGQEDGKPEIIATIFSNGKPAPNIGVVFHLARSFGDLTLGQDTTLDDGTAAAPLPKGLGPDQQGGWTFTITLTSPEAFEGQSKTIAIPSPIGSAAQKPLPRRELWSRAAPWSLLFTVMILVCLAWTAFGFVSYQLYLIRKGGRHA